ncbi:MAG: BolA family protein [Candidatus Dadabacteria bacterium CSP1-2]|jgi:acid stress-induced BolA-like protein IbaG/YrbA|nr:MAG: BolA family protein [Candidatus Dadabacteria bacterium CSP1-2]MBF8301871.1 BolA family protein [Candidatus Dadabacteria bacterium]
MRDGLIYLNNKTEVGIITFMNTKEIKVMIENAMPGSIVNVEGDGTHFEAIVVSSEFEGKGLVDQHQMVYKVLGEAMKDRIHALSLKTYTPQQWKGIK